MAFYGLPPEDLDTVIKLTIQIMDIYKKHDQPVIAADNMLLACRTMGFMENPLFEEAIQQYCNDENGQIILQNISKFWRLHVYTWCCNQAMRIDGSLVECGVHMGLYSLVMMKALEFGRSDKEMFLYDTFGGLSEAFSSSQERSIVDGVYDIPDWEKSVRELFSPYPNAHVVRGVVPDVLHTTAPEAVSFLHLDMNAADAEISAFDFFRSRLSPGAFILLDDFGRSEYGALNRAHTNLFEESGHNILELPTGQGLVVWH